MSISGTGTIRQEAVVILGAAVRAGGQPSRALADRVAAALAWGEAQRILPLYVPTGAVGRHGPAECVVMTGLLRQAGVPPDRIRQEPTGTDTLSSVLACLTLLRAHEGGLRVATHRYHLPRALLLFRLAGREARAVPPPPGPAAGASLARWRWRLREVPAIPYDAALILLARLRGWM